MTTWPQFTSLHEPSATELDTVVTGVRRAIPLKGAYVTNTGGPIATTSGTTELDLAKLQLTGLTLVTGRYYEVRYQITFTKTVAGDSFDLKLRANTAVSGTQIGQHGFNFTDGLTGGLREFGLMFKGDASYTSLYLSVVRSGGTGTLSYYGAVGAFVRTWAQLWDRGDSDNWSDIA
jgi:hypothetical protein